MTESPPALPQTAVAGSDDVAAFGSVFAAFHSRLATHLLELRQSIVKDHEEFLHKFATETTALQQSLKDIHPLSPGLSSASARQMHYDDQASVLSDGSFATIEHQFLQDDVSTCIPDSGPLGLQDVHLVDSEQTELGPVMLPMALLHSPQDDGHGTEKDLEQASNFAAGVAERSSQQNGDFSRADSFGTSAFETSANVEQDVPCLAGLWKRVDSLVSKLESLNLQMLLSAGPGFSRQGSRDLRPTPRPSVGPASKLPEYAMDLNRVSSMTAQRGLKTPSHSGSELGCVLPTPTGGKIPQAVLYAHSSNHVTKPAMQLPQGGVKVSPKVTPRPSNSETLDLLSKPEEFTNPLSPRRQTSNGSQVSLILDSRRVGQFYFGRFSGRRDLTKLEYKLFLFMEDPSSSRHARCYYIAMPVLIISSVFVSLLQTLTPSPIHPVVGAVLETTFDTIFVVEIFTRFVISPTRLVFFTQPFNIIDLFSAMSLVLRASVSFQLPPLNSAECSLSAQCSIIMLVVPVLRLFKTLRRFDNFRLILIAFGVVFEALPILLFTFTVLALISSSAIYWLEPRDNIPSFATAMWLSIVTLTTVGYGDVYPVTSEGSAAVSVLVIISVLYLGMPIGLIGRAFTSVWDDRERILLMWRTRDRLTQWGYGPSDISMLFDHFDESREGGLGLKDFHWLVEHMKLGLTGERILELFRTIDQDESGIIDDKEFVNAVYPDAYYKVFIENEYAGIVEVAEGEEPMKKKSR